MVLFRIGYTPQSGCEADAHPGLGIFWRERKAAVFQSEFGRTDGKLCIPIQPLQPLRRKEFFRFPVIDFGCAASVKQAGIKSCHWSNSRFAVGESFPKSLLRSEEHTSELQSHLNLVCRLLLEKKNEAIKLVSHRLDVCVFTVLHHHVVQLTRRLFGD